MTRRKSRPQPNGDRAARQAGGRDIPARRLATPKAGELVIISTPGRSGSSRFEAFGGPCNRIPGPTATQGLPKGYLTATQGDKTGAKPEQYGSNIRAVPWRYAQLPLALGPSRRASACLRAASVWPPNIRVSSVTRSFALSRVISEVVRPALVCLLAMKCAEAGAATCGRWVIQST